MKTTEQQKLNIRTGHVTDVNIQLRVIMRLVWQNVIAEGGLVFLAYRVGAVLVLCLSSCIPKLLAARFITVVATTSVVALQNVYECYELVLLKQINQRLIMEAGWQPDLLHNELTGAVHRVYLCLLPSFRHLD